MDNNSLPYPRYELKHFGGQPRTPWAGVRVEREGAGAEIVTWQFRDPIDAADELLGCAQSEGLPVVMPQWLREALIAQWQQQGIGLYQKGIAREWCGNSYIRNGWDVAHAADYEPFKSRMQLVNWNS
jgi:hypothetical protein